MNKKGFMKTVEVILIILFFTSIYTYITQRVYLRVDKSQRNPEVLVYDLLTMLKNNNILNSLVMNGDVRNIDNLIEYTLPARFQHNSRIQISDVITIKNSGNDKENISLITLYLFPKYVDTNSINVFTTKANLDKYVKFNWYEKRIDVINNGGKKYNKKYLVKNITLEAPFEINKSTIRYYVNNSFVNISIIYWNYLNTNKTKVNLSFIANIPLIPEHSITKSYLFYTNDTLVNNNYLKSYVNYDEEINFKDYNNTVSKFSELYFYIPKLLSNETKNIIISYTIGSTNKKNDYNKNLINYVNTTKINVNVNYEYIEGTEPIYKDLSKKEIYTVEKWIASKNNKYFNLMVSVW